MGVRVKHEEKLQFIGRKLGVDLLDEGFEKFLLLKKLLQLFLGLETGDELSRFELPHPAPSEKNYIL